MADKPVTFVEVTNADFLQDVADADVRGLLKARESYGDSWKQRGGVGAYMMLARKMDRLENQVKKHGYDVFEAFLADQRSEGIIDDIRDLRRYLMLVEAELVARGDLEFLIPARVSKPDLYALLAEELGCSRADAKDIVLAAQFVDPKPVLSEAQEQMKLDLLTRTTPSEKENEDRATEYAAGAIVRAVAKDAFVDDDDGVNNNHKFDHAIGAIVREVGKTVAPDKLDGDQGHSEARFAV